MTRCWTILIAVLLLCPIWLPSGIDAATKPPIHNNSSQLELGVPPLPVLEDLDAISSFARNSVDDVGEDIAKFFCIKASATLTVDTH